MPRPSSPSRSLSACCSTASWALRGRTTTSSSSMCGRCRSSTARRTATPSLAPTSTRGMPAAAGARRSRRLRSKASAAISQGPRRRRRERRHRRRRDAGDDDRAPDRRHVYHGGRRLGGAPPSGKNPDAAGRIQAEPALELNHVQEALRMELAVSILLRFADEGATVSGVKLPKDMPHLCDDLGRLQGPDDVSGSVHLQVDRQRPRPSRLRPWHAHLHRRKRHPQHRTAPRLRVAERFPRLEAAARDDFLAHDTATPRARHISKLLLTA